MEELIRFCDERNLTEMASGLKQDLSLMITNIKAP